MTTTPDRPGISPDERQKLRAPYAASAVKWLPISNLTRDGKQQFMPHINASLVFERLSDVDPSWEMGDPVPEAGTPDDPMGFKSGAPHRAWLTVCGITRSGRGGVKPGVEIDDKLLKAIESDAIKRAALAFEIGAYLRAFDTVFLPPNVNGKETFKTKDGKGRNQGKKVFAYLTAEGKMQLAAHYDRIIKTKAFADRYGEAVEYGDIAVEGTDLADEEAASEVEAADAPAAEGPQLDTLLVLTQYNGRNTPADVTKQTLTQYPFEKCLAKVLTSVKATLLLSSADTETVRDLAIKASEGDEAAHEQLERELATLADTKDDRAGDAQGALV